MKATQLTILLDQCYSVFNVYGKDPAALEITLRAFTNVLEPIDTGDMQYAFAAWLRTSPNFPTPADIFKLALESQKDREARKAISGHKAAPAPAPRQQSVTAVEWAGLSYQAVLDRGLLPAIQRHLMNTLKPSQRADYALYLVAHMSFPRDFARSFVEVEEFA